MVRSAARTQPLPAPKQEFTTKRFQERAADALLNGFSILGEVVDDFRNSDRFFKYKASVIGLWLLLALLAFARIYSSATSNEINALLVVSGDAASPIYMIKNESRTIWEDVEITVNGTYRSTLARIPGEGGSTVLSAAGLFDERGRSAPPRLLITDIAVKVRDPEAEVMLLGGSVPRR